MVIGRLHQCGGTMFYVYVIALCIAKTESYKIQGHGEVFLHDDPASRIAKELYKQFTSPQEKNIGRSISIESILNVLKDFEVEIQKLPDTDNGTGNGNPYTPRVEPVSAKPVYIPMNASETQRPYVDTYGIHPTDKEMLVNIVPEAPVAGRVSYHKAPMGKNLYDLCYSEIKHNLSKWLLRKMMKSSAEQKNEIDNEKKN